MKSSDRISRTSKDLFLQKFFLKVKDLLDSGKEIFQLGVGDPDEETPELIKEALKESLHDDNTHYMSPTGSYNLKKLISEQYNNFNNETHEVITAMGSRLILTAVMLAYVNKGDKVLIPAPYYPSFVDLTEFSGGIPIIIDTEKTNFLLTSNLVKEKIKENENIKFLILNSPNNPTGVEYDAEELKKISVLCQENNIIIISDECYRYFSPNQDFSMLNINPDTIVVDSFSKKFAMTGWRLGWCVTTKEVAKNIKAVIGKLFSSSNPFIDYSGQVALTHSGIYRYEKEREIIQRWLIDVNIPFVSSSSGLYVFVNFEKYINNTKIKNSLELVEYLLKDAGVAVAPGEAFGDYPKYLRISFCLKEQELQKALNKLKLSLNKLI